MQEIRTPNLGEGVGEATLARWLKQLGERVRKDEALLELETDKASVEVAAECDGVLSAILVEAGSSVDVGAVLGRIEPARAIP